MAMKMEKYSKILLAVELDASCDDLPAVRAGQLAADFKAELYLLHAIEYLSSYGAAYGMAGGAEIEAVLMENARENMLKLAKKMDVPEDRQLIRLGAAKSIILEETEKLGIDLIIVGSHGRHGIRLLLGSTANAVLHAAKCDVLAVRLK
jgi:universal stress protein A